MKPYMIVDYLLSVRRLHELYCLYLGLLDYCYKYPDIVLCVLGAKKLYVYIMVISSMGIVGYYFSLHMISSVLSSKWH